MGASPDQLEREIEQTRAELGRTVREIEQRLKPRRLLADHTWLVVGAVGVLGGLVGWLVSRRRT